MAFRCSEIVRSLDYGADGLFLSVGERLVAKETRYLEQLYNNTFHQTMAKVQAEAAYLASLFNSRVRVRAGAIVTLSPGDLPPRVRLRALESLPGPPLWSYIGALESRPLNTIYLSSSCFLLFFLFLSGSLGRPCLAGERLSPSPRLEACCPHPLSYVPLFFPLKTQPAPRFDLALPQVSFIDCCIYEVLDDTLGYPGGRAWILAEPELEGRFTKYNNNAGSVLGQSPAKKAAASMGAILEEDEDEEEDDGDGGGAGVTVLDVPQCFSHFTWSVTDGDLLVCDLQGVWNADDGYLLTDPAMHRRPGAGRRARGGTDKGKEGIDNFFKTHRCSELCLELGLNMPYT